MLVLATTTPYDLVRPLADLLGFDDVVATRYGVADDGTYNGAIVGHFVWANGKLGRSAPGRPSTASTWRTTTSTPTACTTRRCCRRSAIPLVVNPDPRLRLVAAARRWPILHLDVPEGVPKILGVEPQQVAQAFNRPELIPYARFEFEGEDHIPRRGPAIVVANHRSYFDVVSMSLLFAKSGGPSASWERRKCSTFRWSVRSQRRSVASASTGDWL